MKSWDLLRSQSVFLGSKLFRFSMANIHSGNLPRYRHFQRTLGDFSTPLRFARNDFTAQEPLDSAPMDTLREEVVRQLDELSPEELQAVHRLIRTFKHRPDRRERPERKRRSSFRLEVVSGLRSRQAREEGSEDPVPSRAPAPDAVRRVREALADLPGSFSDVIAEEREK